MENIIEPVRYNKTSFMELISYLHVEYVKMKQNFQCYSGFQKCLFF